MNHKRNLVTSLPALAGLLALAPGLRAQTLLSTSGQVVAANGGQVPGLPTGVIYGGTSTFDSVVVDEAGNVLFRARFQDPGLVLMPPLAVTNDRGYFRGPDMAGLSLIFRNGDAAPGIAGSTLNTASSGGLSGSPRAVPNGEIFFGATISGGATTTSNDTLVYAGPVGAVQVVVRENDLAPTGGSSMSNTFGSGLSYQGVGMNRTGRYVFKTSLAGGDVVGTTNNDAVITGTLGSTPEWVIRKGDLLPSGAVVSATGGFLQQMNDSGQILHDVTLSQTLGTTPATVADDKVLFVYTPGSGNTAVVREGDAAPGTTGATFNNASNTWGLNIPPNGFNQNGQFMMHADLLNGDVVAGVNDRAVYIGSTSGLTLAVRKGDAAPGTDAFFGTWNNSNSAFSNAGAVTIASSITGGTAVSTNDSGIWSGTPGNMQLVVREGDILPGTVATEMVGSSGTFGSLTVIAGDQGVVVFDTDLLNGDAVPAVNSRALCAWSPGLGLRVVVRQGDSVEISAGVFKTVSGYGTVQFNNTDAAPLCLSSNGVLALRLNFTDGTSAIVKITIPIQPGSAFCSGDGSGAACPCGNNGIANRGCANSIDANGGRLVASGTASLSNDSIVLTGSGMPNSSALYIQGTAQQSGGTGIAFGDGLRCAGGSVIRLGTKSNTSGGSQYPAAGDPTVSVRGLVTTPGLRTYQTWYRNAAAFCTTDTFNLTNGWQLVWGL